jgi:hypothetical protein
VGIEADEMALGRLVQACGDAAPVLQPVDQSLDGVAVALKLGVERAVKTPAFRQTRKRP